jgi:hypothetical protein
MLSCGCEPPDEANIEGDIWPFGVAVEYCVTTEPAHSAPDGDATFPLSATAKI